MNKDKSGIALITVMCFMMVLAILGTVFSMAVGSHVRGSMHAINLEKALYVAEAGAERGAAYVGAGGSIPHSFSGSLGDGVYHVTITAQNNLDDEDEGNDVNGCININPNNRTDYQFTLILPNGQSIDRDDLHQDFDGYSGSASSVRVQPKGAGNQNSLTVDGAPYPLSNGLTYLIASSAMTVSLFNDKVNPQGKAMGRWHIIISATGATITLP